MTIQAYEAPLAVLAVSIPKLARLTGLSEGTLYRRANDDSLPGCRKLGKRIFVHLETFNEYMKTGIGVDS
jgi:predicted DNA-binding transcriptional regulator AlpA